MKRWLEAADCAVEGVLYAAKTERHVRFHLYAAAVLLLVCFTFGVNKREFTILTIMAVIVITAEMFNSAIESVVDIVSPEKQEGARIAKDMAAGAVLIPSFVSLIAAYFILKPYVLDFYFNGIKIARHTGGDIAVTSCIFVIIFVVIIKSFLGRGTTLKGGMPSGYSALAFSLFISVSVIYPAWSVFFVSFFLAVLAALSRMFAGEHSLIEVAAGAALGSAVASVLFAVFY